MTLELHPEARNEDLASIEWYDMQVDGLGAEFSREVETSFDRILEDPGRYQIADKILRVIKVVRFPYSIFYRWDCDLSHIFVTSIFHHKRHSGSWQNRTTNAPESLE